MVLEMRYIYTLSILILCIQSVFAQPLGRANTVSISFGNSSRIVYKKSTGSYDVYFNQKKVIADAYSEVKNKELNYKTTAHQFSGLSSINIADQFGKGKKYTFLSKKSGAPDISQSFYVYPSLSYFFTEVTLIGKDISSNYLSPLTSSNVILPTAGNANTLFVPFDNDTFIKYNAKSMSSQLSNTSAEVGAFYDNQSRKGLIVGSVEHMVWKTGIKSVGQGNTLENLTIWAGYSDEGVTRDKIAHGSATGSKVKSPKVFVGCFSDWRSGMEAYAKANRIIEKPFVFNWNKRVPFGWNSWGVIQEKLSYDKAIQVTDFFANELSRFRSGGEAYIDLDSFWDNFTGGMSGDFSKLKEFADHCKNKGLQPGVYWAPFTDWGFQSKNERKAEGGDYKFSEMWTKVNNGYHDFDGARALDPTHPGTLRRIDYIIDKLKACGFTMIKIDFLGHAAAESTSFYNPSITTGMQAYRVGMEYLVKRLDGQMLIYAAISPSLATRRYAHMRMIACDAWKTIKDTEYTLNSITYGWWQTHLYNFIDADHVVFGNERDGVNRARMTSALIAGPIIMGDDYSAEGPWKSQAKQFLQNSNLLSIVNDGKSFTPVDGNTGTSASNMFIKTRGKIIYLAVLNYGNQPKDIVILFDKLGLKNAQYNAVELFSSKDIVLNRNQNITLPSSDAMLFKIAIK